MGLAPFHDGALLINHRHYTFHYLDCIKNLRFSRVRNTHARYKTFKHKNVFKPLGSYVRF